MARKNGLTLMELLVILTALSILVGIVAMSVQDLEAASRDRELRVIEKPAQAALLWHPEPAFIALDGPLSS